MKKRYKLKESHDTHVRLRKLMDYAEELGIRLCFHNASTVTLHDDKNKQEFEIVDVEQVTGRSNHREGPVDFPMAFDFNITFEV